LRARQLIYGDINLVALNLPSLDSRNQTAIENPTITAMAIFFKYQMASPTGMPFRLQHRSYEITLFPNPAIIAYVSNYS